MGVLTGGGSTDTGGGATSIVSDPLTIDGLDEGQTVVENEDLEASGPRTEINLTIQGDVLDSEESGLRIARLLNDATDSGDVLINQGAFA